MYPYYELSAMTYRSANRQTYCDVTYYADRHVRVYYTRESDIMRVPWHLIDKIVILPEANDSNAMQLALHRLLISARMKSTHLMYRLLLSLSSRVTSHNIFWHELFFTNCQKILSLIKKNDVDFFFKFNFLKECFYKK